MKIEKIYAYEMRHICDQLGKDINKVVALLKTYKYDGIKGKSYSEMTGEEIAKSVKKTLSEGIIPYEMNCEL